MTPLISAALLVISQAMSQPSKIGSNEDLISQISRQIAELTPTERMVLRLKALIGWTNDRGALLSVVTGTRAPDGRPWSGKMLGALLDRLKSLGLLDESLSCPAPLLHWLTVEALAAPEGQDLLASVLRSFPEHSRLAHDYSYTFYSDLNVLRRIRLAIYANDSELFAKLLAAYNKGFIVGLCPHILEALFVDTLIEVEWLSSRALDIQYALFAVRLDRCLLTGRPTSDTAAIIAHYRAREYDTGYEQFKWLLMTTDIPAGRIGAARRKVDASIIERPDISRYFCPLFLGTINFLEGHNDEALVNYQMAIKLYRKEIGKRKVFFDGANGIFYLLALIRANNPELYPEIQANLSAVFLVNTHHFTGFKAIQALLWHLRGQELKAREILSELRTISECEPLSAACRAMVGYLVDPKLAMDSINDTIERFETIKGVLPLIARVFAEVLERISDQPAPYDTFLSTTPDGSPLIDFVGIVSLRHTWERTLDSLAAFLKTGGSRSATVAAVGKSKRLVWYVDPEVSQIEVLEQTPKGRDGWSSGRVIAMKRLYEQDPRLDYLSDHDRRVLRTIRKDVSGWYGEEHFDFDTNRTLLALIGHPLIFDARRREQLLELVAYPVELVVSDRGGGYKFALSHYAERPTVFLEPETPTRWRVIDYSSKLQALWEILGSGGLCVPFQGREQVLALLKEQHPSLPIRANIAEADLPVIEGRSEPVLQIQPLDEGLKVAMVVRPFGAAGPYYLAGQGGQSVLAVIDDIRQRANRELEVERALAAAALAALPTLHREAACGHEWVIGDTESALEFLLEVQAARPPLAVEWPEGKRLVVHREVTTSSLSLKVARARDWFQMEGEVRVDEELVLDMQDLMRRLSQANGRFVPLADGSFLALTLKFQKQLER
ncbi:MAG: hypothetical protein WCK65_09025, partial [Rhodospirillaceae bacterium]